MKILFILLILFLPAWATAQSTHSVTLNWQDPLNPAGTTYSVYRSPGLCSGTPVYAKIASAVTSKTYLDDTVTPGNYCFVVTATSNGMESANSNSVAASVPTFAPSALSITVQ